MAAQRGDLGEDEPPPVRVIDRLTVSHEQFFLLSKSERYYFDVEAIKEPTADNTGLRRRRTVWRVANRKEYPAAHFATYPTALIEPCIHASTQPGDTVSTPSSGAARRPSLLASTAAARSASTSTPRTWRSPASASVSTSARLPSLRRCGGWIRRAVPWAGCAWAGGRGRACVRRRSASGRTPARRVRAGRGRGRRAGCSRGWRRSPLRSAAASRAQRLRGQRVAPWLSPFKRRHWETC